MSFGLGIWVTSYKLKSLNNNEDSLQFENAIYRVLYDTSNITAIFEKHLEFSEEMTFTNAIWVVIDTQ